MRFLTVSVLSAVMAASAIGQSFHYGQGARFVLGQNRFDAQGATPYNTDTGEWPAARDILGAAGGIAYVNGKLFVAEGNRVGAQPVNNRVGVYSINNILPQPTDSFPTDDPRRCRVCGGEPDIVLGQPDFVTRNANVSQTGLRQPTHVHSDGQRLVVGDTENNRVLIWNTIPTQMGQPADLVLGQSAFDKAATSLTPSAQRMRAPQGVWIQGNRLFVADTLYHRVLIWNTFPTSTNQAPDVVLGQPDFNTTRPPNLLDDDIPVSSSNMLNPVSATSDGTRLYVSDLGHNRVLIWNSIPTSNNQPADVVVGQPNLTAESSRVSNNSPELCDAAGKDSEDNEIFPIRCGATLSAPRFALSDGQRLFIADGGNDRVMIYNDIPVSDGKAADVILGQPDEFRNVVNDEPRDPSTGLIAYFGENVYEQLRSAVDIIRTPLALATDGFNLFITDAFNRRVLVYSPGDLKVPRAAVRNAASLQVNAIGTMAFSGTLKKDEVVTLKIGHQVVNVEGVTETVDEKTYSFKAPDEDKFAEMINGLANEVNKDGGDPFALATPNVSANSLVLTARAGGPEGDTVTTVYERDEDVDSVLSVTISPTLTGGTDAAKIGVGSLISIFGERMAEGEAVADMNADTLPRKLGNTEYICDGQAIPLMYVSPNQINGQLPFEFQDSFSASCYVRTEFNDGRVESSVAIAVPVVPQNPGIFTDFGPEPRKALAYHAFSRASALIFMDGTAQVDDEITLKIQDREYSYKVVEEDIVEIPDDDDETDDEEIRTVDEINATNRKIREKFINLLNADPDVEAFPTPFFTRILLLARQEGPEVNGTIKLEVEVNDGSSLQIQAVRDTLGGANIAGAPVTNENPLEAGEMFVIYAAGLGILDNEQDNALLKTGVRYTGSSFHELSERLDSSFGTGSSGTTVTTANVVGAVAKPGTFGIYEVTLQLGASLPTNEVSIGTVYQSWYVSNIVTIPVKALPEDEDDDDEDADATTP